MDTILAVLVLWLNPDDTMLSQTLTCQPWRHRESIILAIDPTVEAANFVKPTRHDGHWVFHVEMVMVHTCVYPEAQLLMFTLWTPSLKCVLYPKIEFIRDPLNCFPICYGWKVIKAAHQRRGPALQPCTEIIPAKGKESSWAGQLFQEGELSCRQVSLGKACGETGCEDGRAPKTFPVIFINRVMTVLSKEAREERVEVG